MSTPQTTVVHQYVPVVADEHPPLTEEDEQPGMEEPLLEPSDLDDNDNDDKESEETEEVVVDDVEAVKPDAPSSPIAISTQDGVFSNLNATFHSTTNTNTIPPPSSNEESLPPYAAVAADAVPPYPVVIVSTHDSNNGCVVDGIPVGSHIEFFATLFLTVVFTTIGFLLGYGLSRTHAGRYGATTGLGLVVIHWGLLITRANRSGPYQDDQGADDDGETMDSSAFFLSYALIFIGWMLTLRSLSAYGRVVRLSQMTSSAPLTEGEEAV